MSYNLTAIKIIKLDNFKIPVNSLFKTSWRPMDKEVHDNGTVTYSQCESEITGVIENDIFVLENFNCVGEGSGTMIRKILEPAFEDSEGELKVLCVWEDGDTIDILHVKYGEVFWKDIDPYLEVV